MDLKDRKREIDVQKLTPEQADELSTQIGEKIRLICDKAVLDANRILNIYGMEAKMQIAISEIAKMAKEEEKTIPELPVKKKKGRPRKQPNL
jgi:hypothetical protein